ncbi:MAG: DUF367 family protein [Methanobacteriota archaeon]|nr:MAG: DUF367 family protein [Euryarchaeota archaeon]
MTIMIAIMVMDPLSKIKIIYLNQCDIKKCSGHRLLKLGFAKRIRKQAIKKAIVLSPTTSIALSPSDRDIFAEFGLVGIDGSWNQIDTLYSLFSLGTPRALPFLVAANTVNFGKPTKLNTAEAIISALWILGFEQDATRIAKAFKYGQTFIDLNYDRLDAYSRATDSKEVVRLQKEFMDELYGED